jgi:hypothetical protein
MLCIGPFFAQRIRVNKVSVSLFAFSSFLSGAAYGGRVFPAAARRKPQ